MTVLRALFTFLIGSSLLAGLVACTPKKAEPDLATFPASLKGATSLELGQLVLLLMPATGVDTIRWDHQANSAILWKSSGYDVTSFSGNDNSSRTGVVRVNLLGVVSTGLRQRKEEMGWTVTYTSKSNPKFGVERIDIQPGGVDGPCFGETYEGCSFDPPTKSLENADIKATELCKSPMGGDMSALYRLEHAGKRTMLLLWSTSGGSGGSSSSIALLVDHGKGTSDGECSKIKPNLPAPLAAVVPPFSDCLTQAIRQGEYSSHDGGESALRLTSQCHSQLMAYLDSCVAQGSAENECMVNAGILAQSALKLSER